MAHIMVNLEFMAVPSFIPLITRKKDTSLPLRAPGRPNWSPRHF
jgi:hypothetical protein